jgi:hypothetical protein
LRTDDDLPDAGTRPANDVQNGQAGGRGTQVDHQIPQAGAVQQLFQGPGNRDELGMALLGRLVKDAGESSKADGFIGDQTDPDWVRNANRRHLASPVNWQEDWTRYSDRNTHGPHRRKKLLP